MSRQTWLVNENKSYPWDKSPIFKEPTQNFRPVKKIVPKVTESPNTREAQGSQSTRLKSFSPKRHEENSQT